MFEKRQVEKGSEHVPYCSRHLKEVQEETVLYSGARGDKIKESRKEWKVKKGRGG